MTDAEILEKMRNEAKEVFRIALALDAEADAFARSIDDKQIAAAEKFAKEEL